MYTVKMIEPNILELESKTLSFHDTKVDKFYWVSIDGEWLRIHNDRLETAQHAVAGTLTELEAHYVRPMDEASEVWFRTHYLTKLDK